MWAEGVVDVCMHVAAEVEQNLTYQVSQWPVQAGSYLSTYSQCKLILE